MTEAWEGAGCQELQVGTAGATFHAISCTHERPNGLARNQSRLMEGTGQKQTQLFLATAAVFLVFLLYSLRHTFPWIQESLRYYFSAS